MKDHYQKAATRGNAILEFFRLEAAGGIVLVGAAIVALLIANSPLNPLYSYFFNDINFRIGFSEVGGGDFQIKKPILLWINDGMMAVFFFLVGLEIKRELLQGELSRRERAILPLIAAIGGMAVPAAIFWYLNRDNPANMSGWAIPCATDIAFALGVLALLGSRAPLSLKILLTAIAIIDDLGAILIIAIFYADQINLMPLCVAAAALAALVTINLRGVSRIAPYMLLGLVMWVAVLESGIHATIAGVITAFTVPLTCRARPGHSPATELEHGLHPWVAFGVLPVFGFANAGVSFAGISAEDIFSPVTAGIALGLFVGKQIGVFGFLWLTIVSGLSPRPEGTTWRHLYGVSLLCGIGFTMSLFIGALAYDGIEMQASVRIGVLVGSIASASLAYAVLRFAPQQHLSSATS